MIEEGHERAGKAPCLMGPALMGAGDQSRGSVLGVSAVGQF